MSGLFGNLYQEKIGQGISHEQMMAAIHTHSRDNARTPMQWDASANAGFSQATPWLKLNPNYHEINVQKDRASEDSIFAHYQQLIRLRKQHEILVYGEFELLLPEHKQIFAYLRHYQKETLLVVNNFSEQLQLLELPDEITKRNCESWISNDKPRSQLASTVTLNPYESFIMLLK